MRKKFISLSLIFTIALSSMYGCDTKEDDNKSLVDSFSEMLNSGDDNESNENIVSEKFDIDVNFSDKEKLSVTKSDLGNYNNVISLNGEGITITESGEYVLEGKIDNGQIIVDIPDSDDKVVTLIFNGVDISCDNSSAVYVKNAKKVVLSLVADTTNTFTDGSDYVYDDEAEEEPNACIFSKDDLVIAGTGTLIVNGNFNNGIYSKDDLTITGGNIDVKAVNHGVKGKDSISILDGDISIEADGDGMCSTNNVDEGEGFILIENGTYNITSGQDGIAAETCLLIKNGQFNITTGEGAKVTSWGNNDMWGNKNNPMRPGMDMEENNTESDTVSKKAVKASVDITINAGEFIINSEDDAIHSNGSISIENGEYEIKSGDDGVHADNSLTINEGNITINQCYEGIEGTNIVVNNGNIYIMSTDDGFNAAGGNDSSAMMGRPGMNNFGGSTGSLEINGGYIYMNASGDGLDSNGNIVINDGFIIVDGPENGGNGAMDYDSSCEIKNGFLLAVGYGQMAQMPNNADINCVMIGFNNVINAGDIVNIKNSTGEDLLTYSGAKSYNNLVLCTSMLETGKEYTISIGGTCDGTALDGVYTGAYEGGEVYETFTVSGIQTTVGNANGGMGGQMPGGQMPGGNMGKPGGGRR